MAGPDAPQATCRGRSIAGRRTASAYGAPAAGLPYRGAAELQVVLRTLAASARPGGRDSSARGNRTRADGGWIRGRKRTGDGDLAAPHLRRAIHSWQRAERP